MEAFCFGGMVQHMAFLKWPPCIKQGCYAGQDRTPKVQIGFLIHFNFKVFFGYFAPIWVLYHVPNHSPTSLNVLKTRGLEELLCFLD